MTPLASSFVSFVSIAVTLIKGWTHGLTSSWSSGGEDPSVDAAINPVLSPCVPHYRPRYFRSGKAYVLETYVLQKKDRSKQIQYQLIHPCVVSNLVTDRDQFQDLLREVEERWSYQGVHEPCPPGSPVIGNKYSFHMGIFYQPNGFREPTSAHEARGTLFEFDWGSGRLNGEYYFDDKRALIVIRVMDMRLRFYKKPILSGVLLVPLFSPNIPHIVNPNLLTAHREGLANQRVFPGADAMTWQKDFKRSCEYEVYIPREFEHSLEDYTSRNFVLPDFEIPARPKGALLR
jgi:hypothetical protein